MTKVHNPENKKCEKNNPCDDDICIRDTHFCTCEIDLKKEVIDTRNTVKDLAPKPNGWAHECCTHCKMEHHCEEDCQEAPTSETGDECGERHIAISPEAQTIRPVLAKYQNEWKAGMLTDLCLLLTQSRLATLKEIKERAEEKRKNHQCHEDAQPNRCQEEWENDIYNIALDDIINIINEELA